VQKELKNHFKTDISHIIMSQISLDDLLAAHDGVGHILRQFDQESLPLEEDDGVTMISATDSTITTVAQDTNDFSVGEDGDQSRKKVEDFIETLTQLITRRNELIIALKNKNINEAREASDQLTQIDKLEKRIEWCTQVKNHLVRLSKNKDVLIYNLQQPLVTSYLTIHHKYHKDLLKLIGGSVDLLNNTTPFMETIQEHSGKSLMNISDSCVNSLTQKLGNTRNRVDNISVLLASINDMVGEDDQA